LVEKFVDLYSRFRLRNNPRGTSLHYYNITSLSHHIIIPSSLYHFIISSYCSTISFTSLHYIYCNNLLQQQHL